MTTPSNMTRTDALDALHAAPDVPVLVIGGGINGISVFRELALQGIKVVLVERADFCSGASSALSRMVHGGLRYLENGEFGLVRESLHERDRLLRNAPHYVAPLPTSVPIFDIFSGIANGAIRFLGLGRRPSRRGALMIKAGLSLYDLFTAHRRMMPKHSFRNRTASLARWPRINPKIKYSATYYDAWISQPERLGIEMLTDTLAECPSAYAINHASVVRMGDGFGIKTDNGSASVPLNPAMIINATGGWIDLTNAEIGAKNQPLMGGTKGSHLIIKSAELYAALGGHMIYYENDDGRICILFPYLGNVLVGSTDIRVDDPGMVRCEPDERDYILQSLSFVFPDITVKPGEIAFQFAGVRPLPASDDSFTGRIPRDHYCETIAAKDGMPPVLCMIGGKWTTFRSFGALAADQVLARLDHQRTCNTETQAIGGGRDYPEDSMVWCRSLANATGLPTDQVQTLFDRYGTRAKDIAQFISGAPDNLLSGARHYSTREMLFLIRHEFAARLDDLLLRRTSLGITGTLSQHIVDSTLSVLSAEYGWSAIEAAAERQRFLDLLLHQHGLNESTLISRNEKGSAECATA